MSLDDSLRFSSATTLNPPSESPHSTTPDQVSRSTSSIAFPLAFAAIAIAVVVLFAAILKINDHTFIYTLDDPYIHLALSDQIRHGNYGLYDGTHAAPSSSIIFPFLLAVASGTALHPYLPLLINLCALFFTVEVIRRLIVHVKLGHDTFAISVQAGFLFLITLCSNLIGVVFTGLEHSLHIAFTAAIVYGLALLLDTRKMPAWLPAVIILCPLVRYEGLALSMGALLVLALRGRLRTALAAAVAIAILMGGFSAFLVKLGLPPLPSSILSKSAVAAGGIGGAHHQLLAGLSRNFNFALFHPIGVTLLLVSVAALCICAKAFVYKPRGWTSRSLMALVLLVSIGGHIAAGSFGWLDRYEDYIMVSTALICLYLGQSAIRSALAPARKDRLIVAFGAAVALLVIGSRYCHETFKVPIASNNIYEQQYQMHRFIDGFYKGAVAVNDLGLSSYHNPYPVLDLGGLGSEKARLLIAAHANSADYEKFVAANNVHLVIVYEEWFPGQIPDTWHQVGTISVSRALISAAQGDVQFYATDNATATTVKQELEAFGKVLPPRVDLTIY